MAWLEHSLDGIHACSSGLMQVTHDTSHSAGCDRATRLCVCACLCLCLCLCPHPTTYCLSARSLPYFCCCSAIMVLISSMCCCAAVSSASARASLSPSSACTAAGVLSAYPGMAIFLRSASMRPVASPAFFCSLASSRVGSRMPWRWWTRGGV